jgi:hypothetical protein
MNSNLLVDDRLEFGEFQSVKSRLGKKRSQSKATQLPRLQDMSANDSHMEDLRQIQAQAQAQCMSSNENVDTAAYHRPCPLPTNLIIASQPIFTVPSLGLLPLFTANTIGSFLVSTNTSEPRPRSTNKRRRRLLPLPPKQKTIAL